MPVSQIDRFIEKPSKIKENVEKISRMVRQISEEPGGKKWLSGIIMLLLTLTLEAITNLPVYWYLLVIFWLWKDSPYKVRKKRKTKPLKK